MVSQWIPKRNTGQTFGRISLKTSCMNLCRNLWRNSYKILSNTRFKESILGIIFEVDHGRFAEIITRGISKRSNVEFSEESIKGFLGKSLEKFLQKSLDKIMKKNHGGVP